MRRTSERGSAMIIVTILVLVLAATSVALLTEVAFTQKAGKESLDADEGWIIARTGLEKTRRALYQYYSTALWNPLLLNGEPQWTDILIYNDPNQVVVGTRFFNTNAPDYVDQVRANFEALKGTTPFTTYRANPTASGAATSSESPPKTATNVIFGQCMPYRGGAYHVAIRNNPTDPGGLLVDTDRIVIATVTSVLEDGQRTVRRLESELFYNLGTYDPEAAIVANGSLNIPGNPTIRGLKGSVHANQNLVISGNPIIEDNATAQGTLDISGTPTVGGTLAGGQPPKPVPPINVADFFDDRDYLLRADGRIFNKSGVLVHNGSGGAAWHGFKWAAGSPNKWDLVTPTGDGVPPPATYYIEGMVVVSSNIGNGPGDPPVRATFISTKSFEISGNPGLAPYLGDVQVISGTDIKIGGSPDLDDYQGFYGAREQIMVSGNPQIFGALVAENAANTDTTVALGAIGSSQLAVQISGDARITFNGGLNSMIGVPSSVDIVQLRMIR